MALLEMGVQSGEPRVKDADIVGMLHRAILKAFTYNPSFSNQTDYFKTLEYFWIGLRVSGKYRDFCGEGLENLKKTRGKSGYEIDLVIPEHRWKGVGFDEFRSYFLEGVRQCFELMVAKAKKDKELINEEKLRHDFEAGMKLIAEAAQDDDLFQRLKPEEEHMRPTI